MEPVGVGVGLVAGVIQIYTAVTKVYDMYLQVADFPATYRVLRVGLLIERHRLELWSKYVLSGYQDGRLEISPHDLGLWKLFETIFNSMWEAFKESNQTMEGYGQHIGLPQEEGLSDWEILESMTLSAKSPPKTTLLDKFRKFKFVLRDKKKLEQLIITLREWNDSLDKMLSRVQQESARRRLRTRLSTGDTEQLQELESMAAMLNHADIQRMASARIVIEQGYQSEEPASPLDETFPSLASPSNYRLEHNQLESYDFPFMTNKVRTLAAYNQESVVIDWRCYQDDTWRRENPVAFRRRTENLAKILNSDLKPLNLSILHCVGYLEQSSTVTGYAFRLPPEALPGQKPCTLYELLTKVNRASDCPDLGERFELAKALVSTVFEIHNIGWLHKNIHPQNILFWPKSGTKDEPNISKPYLMGFDISRPNQPGEVSEKPLTNLEDDLYRHPDYKGTTPRSFRPSFDLYSLGVILYEIGMWRHVGHQPSQRSSRLTPATHISDPQFIVKAVMNGPVMDLKRFTGCRYRDAVIACLNRQFDVFWENTEMDPTTRFRRYQDEVQDKVVDMLAGCNA